MVRLRLEELLEQRGITAYRLAVDTGIGHTALWKLRHGKQPSIKLDYIERLCRVLDCTPNELIQFDSRTEDKRREKAKPRPEGSNPEAIDKLPLTRGTSRRSHRLIGR